MDVIEYDIVRWYDARFAARRPTVCGVAVAVRVFPALAVEGIWPCVWKILASLA